MPDLGHASGEEIAVKCGEPERVAVSDEELRRRGETPTGADLATPISEPTRLFWDAQYLIVGGALRVERGGHTIVDGAILSEEYGDSQLRWWRALCSPE